jgi:hypothetical protein
MYFSCSFSSLDFILFSPLLEKNIYATFIYNITNVKYNQGINMTNIAPIVVGVVCVIIAFFLRSASPGYPPDEWLFTLLGIAFIWWGGWIGALD